MFYKLTLLLVNCLSWWKLKVYKSRFLNQNLNILFGMEVDNKLWTKFCFSILIHNSYFYYTVNGTFVIINFNYIHYIYLPSVGFNWILYLHTLILWNCGIFIFIVNLMSWNCTIYYLSRKKFLSTSYIIMFIYAKLCNVFTLNQV